MHESRIGTDYQIGAQHDVGRFHQGGFPCKIDYPFRCGTPDFLTESIFRTGQNDKSILRKKGDQRFPIGNGPAFHFPVGRRHERNHIFGYEILIPAAYLIREMPVAIGIREMRNPPLLQWFLKRDHASEGLVEMIDSQFEQQKALASLLAPQSNVRFRKRQWSHYQLQYVGTDITVGIINVVEMLFSQISRHFQQPGKPGSLVKRPDFINPAIHRQGPHHILPGNPMNFHICKPFTYSTDNSHTLDNIPYRTETDN